MSQQPESLDGLRKMVREALGDLLPEIARSLPGRGSGVSPVGGGGAGGSGRDGRNEDRCRSRRLRWTPAQVCSRIRRRRTTWLQDGFATAWGAMSRPVLRRPVRRVEKGAVTEATVKEAARSGASIVLGPQAVLTPLGRDRAQGGGMCTWRRSTDRIWRRKPTREPGRQENQSWQATR